MRLDTLTEAHKELNDKDWMFCTMVSPVIEELTDRYGDTCKLATKYNCHTCPLDFDGFHEIVKVLNHEDR